MQNNHVLILQRVVALLAGVLVLKITLAIVLNYRSYFPPDFESDFLAGRKPYFFGIYGWAFYSHIVSGACSLVLGLVLVAERFRKRFPSFHRMAGKIQIACVLLLVTPSGLWMSFHSATGVVAGTGFGALAIATGVCAALGWRMAVARRFAEHRRWMWRCFLLLCSAVVFRLIGGIASIAEADPGWAYPFAAWASWIAPLAVFEVIEWARKSNARSGTMA